MYRGKKNIRRVKLLQKKKKKLLIKEIDINLLNVRIFFINSNHFV